VLNMTRVRSTILSIAFWFDESATMTGTPLLSASSVLWLRPAMAHRKSGGANLWK